MEECERMKTELLKVVNIALVLVALFITSCSSGDPSKGLGAYPKAMGAADEGSTIQALRTIASAETQLKVMRGAYGNFEALTTAGLLDERFAGTTPNLKGYLFNLNANETDFTVRADPQTTETQHTTGSRHFYLDSSDNGIHVNATQSASKNDPLL